MVLCLVINVMIVVLLRFRTRTKQVAIVTSKGKMKLGVMIGFPMALSNFGKSQWTFLRFLLIAGPSTMTSRCSQCESFSQVTLLLLGRRVVMLGP